MNDFYGYLERMGKTISDKLFFVNSLDLDGFDFILDFGCANGVLISNLASLFPNAKFVGYDKSKKMIKEAHKKIKNHNITFTTSLDKINKDLNDKKFLIIFSSVLHEVEDEIGQIIDLMKESSAVVIRDMYFDKSKNKKINSSKILASKYGDKFLISFENQYGKIDNLLNLYHYLLKYTYEENWASELKENYFSIDYDRIINELTSNGFKIELDEPFTLPFKKEEIKNNFNYDLKLPTHRKLILTKLN